jgi:hypothetical protein
MKLEMIREKLAPKRGRERKIEFLIVFLQKTIKNSIFLFPIYIGLNAVVEPMCPMSPMCPMC